MKLVLIAEKDLQQASRKKYSLIGITKKPKEVTKILNKYALKHALETQWNTILNSGIGVACGFQYQFRVIDVFEDVKPQPVINMDELFEEKQK